mmetsp:Transcript_65018/g.145213  ORF Transcript_65018/g.145213 Transcript_65018/m.145213 type:complete len:338 (-) Transcript_65018:437-1450(-)
MWAHSVLFIGNSYSADLAWAYRELLVSARKFAAEDVNVQQFTQDSWTLARHWNLAFTEPGSTLGRYLGNAWGANAWDFVVLQEQSQLPSLAGATDLESTNAFANSAAAVTLLGRLITENGGTVRLIGTWGDQDGDKDHHDFSPNFATMQAHLDRGFTRYLDVLAGAGVPAEIIPIGAAWTFAKSGAFVNGDDDDNDDDDEHGDTLFSKLYKRDGAHPSVHGTYLAACVVFANILHSSPVGIEWAPEKISERDKLMLQQYAEAAWFGTRAAVGDTRLHRGMTGLCDGHGRRPRAKWRSPLQNLPTRVSYPHSKNWLRARASAKRWTRPIVTVTSRTRR